VRLADGLAAIEPGDAVTAISLCGMGGEKIRNILASGKSRLSGQERLILQPNGDEQPLRQWLMDNDYRILCEEVLRENRFAYEIIVAERSGPVIYSAEELYFGPLQMQARALSSWLSGSASYVRSSRPWRTSLRRSRLCPRKRCRRSPGRRSGLLNC
jgi:tRNA (adenine22-N1)-methyltransferase